MPGDPVLVGPAQYRVGGQFGAIVGNDRYRPASARHDAVELARDPQTGDRSVGDERQALPGADVAGFDRKRFFPTAP